ncbi:NAD(P)-binding domain-containing protein [Salinarimonas ramus]|uniref:Flavoprotein n=1 Tax=Salinarimonas ramus TaxID=690164 RepID=A0A917QCF0_9HYPH|nr:NAD(P)-binding domain-containing protein [Salinarimonas ramus]GGK43651.1 flavoprotein [Salinarimonas ramus]
MHAPSRSAELPIAILGAGPVGLAAAAHCAERGLPFLVLEAGPAVGANLREWGHVRLFSPWRYDVDAASRRLLEREGWVQPDPDSLPTGAEMADRYLAPLAEALAAHGRIVIDARVRAVTRAGLDKVKSARRAQTPFLIDVEHGDGRRSRHLARAVVDASGTWSTPNPLGGTGIAAIGESEAAGRIRYRIPDALGADRAVYAGARTLVVGAGHSAANAVIDLAGLVEQTGTGSITWAVRGARPIRAFGGGAGDELPARGALGARLQALVADGRVRLVTGFAAEEIREADAGGVLVADASGRTIGPFDRLVALTGQRPDLAPLRELRIDLDPWLECSRALAADIDPNVHACGSVTPHGHAALAHPEPGFYVVGAKSYGRAPTFLMMTGYEQVRSVVAALAGAEAEADRVELVLPKTGVCSTDLATGADACCAPAPEGARGCCGAPAAQDAPVPARVGARCGAAA